MPSRLKLRCPICKKAVTTSSKEFPFCSPHCKDVDLGKWASGAYVIPSPSLGADGEEAIPDRNLDDGDESL